MHSYLPSVDPADAPAHKMRDAVMDGHGILLALPFLMVA